jgi:hypothetical protein
VLRVAAETARKTAMKAIDPPSQGMPPGGDLDACTRCGGTVAYSDSDGVWCFGCGRLREAV